MGGAISRTPAPKDTPILEDIQALDAPLPAAGVRTLTLHWAKGAVASFDDFAPQQTALKPGQEAAPAARRRALVEPGAAVLQPRGRRRRRRRRRSAGAASGRPISPAARRAARDAGRAWRTRTSCCTPARRSAPRAWLLLFYQGDRWRGQNLLRQFLLAHHRPQPRRPAARRADHLRQLGRHARRGPPRQHPPDHRAASCPSTTTGSTPSGTAQRRLAGERRQLDREARTSTRTASSRSARRCAQSGRELMLWFEPERVFKGTPWHREHAATGCSTPAATAAC